MEFMRVLKKSETISLKDYFYLTKPGIIFGNALTATLGFTFASNNFFNLSLFLWMILGLSFIIGSACAFNNIIDVPLDLKMPRTQNRALPQKRISHKSAIIYASILLALGAHILFWCVSTLSMIFALFGFILYVGVYSRAKYTTPFCTLIGSFSGAIPPLVGYFSISKTMTLSALMLFILIALWQMPHFFAIAIYRLKDYAKAEIPLYPFVYGVKATKREMIIFSLLFTISIFLTSYMNLATPLFAIILGPLSACWFFLCCIGLKTSSDEKWAKVVFRGSLIIVIAMSVLAPFTAI